MLLLVPSAPNAVGNVWLALHFDHSARLEESALEIRVGVPAWRKYVESGAPRWLSPFSVSVLIGVVLLCMYVEHARTRFASRSDNDSSDALTPLQGLTHDDDHDDNDIG